MDFNHLELFSMNPKMRKRIVKKKQKGNPAAIKGLTPEEKKQLEDAEKAADERARLRIEELKEKVRKAEAEREAKKSAMEKKVEKSRKMSIERDLRARAKTADGDEKGAGVSGETKTENLRHAKMNQLSQLIRLGSDMAIR
jgi:hypothetical protein